MAAKLEHVITRDLRIIGREIACFYAIIFVAARLPVCLNRQVAATARRRPAKMAGEARHCIFAVRAVRLRHARPPAIGFAIIRFADQFGARCFHVEMCVFRINRILHEADPPLNLWIDQRALDQNTISIWIIKPFKTPLAIRISQQGEVRALWGRSGPRCQQRGIGVRCAVAILAANLDSVGNFAVNQAVAVTVLSEMAVCALHPFFRVNIHHVHAFAGVRAHFYKLAFTLFAPLFRVVGIDNLALRIKQIALAVALQDGAEIPAVAVIIRELSIFEFGIQIINVAQEVQIRPQPLGRRSLRITFVGFPHFRRRRIALRFEYPLIIRIAHACGLGRLVLRPRPHERRIGFVIPHRVAEEGIEKDIGLMHVAIHALRCRNGARKGVLERMTLFLLRHLARFRIMTARVMATHLMAFALGLTINFATVRRGRAIVSPAKPATVPAAAFHQILDRRIHRGRLTVTTIFCIDKAVARLTVIGINHVATCTS